MKKIATLFALACIGYAPYTQAQVILSETFESTTGTSLPTGWTQTNVGATTWKTGINTGLQSQYFPIEAHTRMVAFNDDAAGSTALNTDQFLKTASINLSSATAPALSFDLFYLGLSYNSIFETLKIEVSTNGGTNWTVLQTVTGNTAVAWQTRYVSLAAYAGQSNVMIGFRYSDGGEWLYGAAMDNITVYNMSANDAAVSGVTFPSIAQNGTPLTVTVMNTGASTITSLAMNFDVDGGTPSYQNFAVNIPSLGTANVTFAPLVGNFNTTAAHIVTAKIYGVNGSSDANPNNNQMAKSFNPATQTVSRNGLIEEFSSSTCPPCASFNATFDPLVTGTTVNANVAASKFNVIKYQMNWPSPNNDRSYNAHGATRQAYYGVSGIPDHYTNGAAGGAGDLAEINASKTAPAFIGIWGTYQINAGTMNVSYTVTPFFSGTGNYSIHAVSVQREFDLLTGDPSHTTSQSHFVLAERRMFPDGNGYAVTSFTAGTPVTQSWNAQAFAVGNVQQGNFEYWSNPVASDLVVFVQDNTTGEVLQSQVIAPTWPTNTANIENDTKVIVYPNPATDHAVIALNMENAATVKINITDALGRIVFNNAQNLDAGRHEVYVNTMSLAAGLYNVTIQTEKGTITERLSVAK